VRNTPRLSVDIDLTYVPTETREISLAKIGEGIKRIKAKIERTIPNTKVTGVAIFGSTHPGSLVVATSTARIKIEVNLF